MSIEQQIAALIVALQENTVAQLGNVPAAQETTPAPAPAAQPTQTTQAPAPAAAPVPEQPIPAATQTGTAPQAAPIPTAAAPVTPGVAAGPAAASPSEPAQAQAAGAPATEYGLNELRAEVLAKYNATNKSTAVTDLVQRYGGGNVSAIAVEQYGNFLGELRAIA